MKRGLGLILGCIAVLAAGAVAAGSEGFQRENEAWRADRLAKLTAPDGWLTLVGLHYLKVGENTIGSAPGNDITLKKGPSRLGAVDLTADGRVRFSVVRGVEALIDGQRVPSAELTVRSGMVKPSLVTFGTMSFFALEAGARKALRVKDSESERRTGFVGLDYFPADPAWRVEARWEAFEKSRIIQVTDVLGQVSPALVPGKAVFERNGQRFELLAIDEGPGLPLFFVFADATSGKETYGACRFIYADLPKDGIVVLDFNRAENPPCAFTPFAMCPLPPKGNRLPFAVNAGEKTYRGQHD